MRTFIALGFILTSGSVFAQYLKCGPTNRFGYESFGLGIDAMVSGSSFSYQWLDSECFNLGRMKASQTLSEADSTPNCHNQYSKGFSQAMRVTGEVDSACFNLGYSAGISLLGVGARENDSRMAPAACIKAYALGYKVGVSGDGSNAPSVQPAQYCYNLGFRDGTSYRY